jgi:hypothetical protein
MISLDFSLVCILWYDFFQLLSSANTYAAKKTVAQGMMDIALITANANQLRYILEFGGRNTVFYITTTLIVISILLQVQQVSFISYIFLKNNNIFIMIIL